MAEKRNAHHAGEFGDELRSGQGEDGRQMQLLSTSLTNVITNPETGFAKAQRRADEAIEYLAVYPMAWRAAKRHARQCIREGRRIETHALVAAVKAAGGREMRFNNNHGAFLTRLLARDSASVAANLEFRGSMYDQLDLGKYLEMVRNQQRLGL